MYIIVADTNELVLITFRCNVPDFTNKHVHGSCHLFRHNQWYYSWLLSHLYHGLKRNAILFNNLSPTTQAPKHIKSKRYTSSTERILT